MLECAQPLTYESESARRRARPRARRGRAQRCARAAVRQLGDGRLRAALRRRSRRRRAAPGAPRASSASRAPGTPRAVRSATARRSRSRPARCCRRAPTPSSRVERTSARDGHVDVLAAVAAGNDVRRAGEDIGAGQLVLAAGTSLGPAHARRARVARVWRDQVLRAPARRRADDRRRALRARTRAAARRDLQLELLLACRRSRASVGAQVGLTSTIRDEPRATADSDLARARDRRRRRHLRRRLRRRARPRPPDARRARRRRALLGRRAEARQADVVRHARAHARLRPARQPRLGDGHVHAVRRAPRCARSPAARPTPRGRRALLARDVAKRARPRRKPCAAGCARASAAGSPSRPARRARTCSPRCSAPTRSRSCRARPLGRERRRARRDRAAPRRASRARAGVRRGGPMTVSVRLFALLRERAGCDRSSCSSPTARPSPTRSPSCRGCRRSASVLARLPVQMAVNRDYATPATPLAAADELALIPPLSGGAARVHVDVVERPLDLASAVGARLRSAAPARSSLRRRHARGRAAGVRGLRRDGARADRADRARVHPRSRRSARSPPSTASATSRSASRA